MLKNYKLYFALFSFLLLTFLTKAQIPNAGFENWHTAGFPSYNEPDNWGTLNSSTALISVYTVEKATGTGNVHSGNSAVKLSTHYISFANQTAPGICVTGSINTSNQSINGGFPYTGRPVKLTGWFKGAPATGDTGRVEVYLFKNNGTSQITVADGIFTNGATVSTYTQFFITLNYHTSDIPDTARILLFSSNPDNPIEPSNMFIDDLSFIECTGFGTTVSTDDATHVGWTDGSATANPTGGTTPYIYSWSTGGTTQTISSIGAGNYCVTVSDNNGCTASACGNVNNPSCNGLSVSVSTTNVSSQGASDGSATANVTGGSPAYTYAWNNTLTTSSINGLSASNYCVTVEDNVGCTATACGIVSSPSCTGFGTSVSTAAATLVNGTDGQAWAVNTGGAAPYSFSWSNSGITDTITGLSAGTYCVTVTDANSCIASACGSVSQPSCTGFGAVVSITDVTTVGGSDGTATAVPTGGVTPYTYFWNNLSTSQAITNLPVGLFCVTVTDHVGCVQSACDSVHAHSCTGFGLTLTATDQTDTPDGSVTSTVLGGTSPFAYAWSNSATTANITNLAAGSYCLTVTDAGNCSSSACDTVGTSIGIAELQSIGIRVFPNPANNLLTVTKQSDDYCTINLFSADGKLVLESLLSAKSTQLNISQLADGTYLGTVKNNATNSTAHYKLLITH